MVAKARETLTKQVSTVKPGYDGAADVPAEIDELKPA
jgi:hypothetical protein